MNQKKKNSACLFVFKKTGSRPRARPCSNVFQLRLFFFRKCNVLIFYRLFFIYFYRIERFFNRKGLFFIVLGSFSFSSPYYNINPRIFTHPYIYVLFHREALCFTVLVFWTVQRQSIYKIHTYVYYFICRSPISTSFIRCMYFPV